VEVAIGMTIARALIEAMGGRLWAESPGAGRAATFIFTLPAVA
jgi:signal transduction histidine kinase